MRNANYVLVKKDKRDEAKLQHYKKQDTTQVIEETSLTCFKVPVRSSEPGPNLERTLCPSILTLLSSCKEIYKLETDDTKAKADMFSANV